MEQKTFGASVSISSGTLILCARTAHGVYLASDSRSSSPLSDSAQKLFRYGDAGFIALCGTVTVRAGLPVATGNPVTSVLDLMSMLDVITTGYDGVCNVIDYTTERCYGIMKPFWEQFIEPAPQAFLAKFHKVVCTLPVVFRKANVIEVGEIQFPFSPEGQLLTPTWASKAEEVTAWGQLPEDPERIPTYSDSAISVLRYINTVYSEAARNPANLVGGQTDIGFVDKHGTYWVRRKIGPYKSSVYQLDSDALKVKIAAR